MSKILSVQQAKRGFDIMCAHSTDGVQGVLVIDSGIAGPTLGITAFTHGNEPSGGIAHWHLLENMPLADRILCGRVVLAVHNINAARSFFAATTEAEKEAARATDVNFNRLPEDAMSRIHDDRYEVQRAQELKPFWDQLTVGLDIHSTLRTSRPMIVSGGGFEDGRNIELVRGFPIDIIISNIHVAQIGLPAYGFFGGGREIPVFEIESGCHEDPEAFQITITCVEALLANLGMVDGDTGAGAPVEMHEYYIDSTLVFPNRTYQQAKIWTPFEVIPAGTVLATGDGDDIVMPWDGHAVFPSKDRTPQSIAEEVMFISRPVKTIRV